MPDFQKISHCAKWSESLVAVNPVEIQSWIKTDWWENERNMASILSHQSMKTPCQRLEQQEKTTVCSKSSILMLLFFFFLYCSLFNYSFTANPLKLLPTSLQCTEILSYVNYSIVINLLGIFCSVSQMQTLWL